MALEALSGRVGPGRSAGEFVDLSVCPCASGDHAIPQPAVSKQEGATRNRLPAWGSRGVDGGGAGNLDLGTLVRNPKPKAL